MRSDFLTGNVFGVTSSNVKEVGNGVFTDASTFGTFPQAALDHWAAIGIRHNNVLRTTPQSLKSGGEHAILKDGAGAEIMIRAANTNVINITDFGLASWDFHQTSGGQSSNGLYSRRKMLGTNSFSGDRIAPLKTFLDRMLGLDGHNVVVCISGELVRLPSGDHGDGTVAAMFGKNIKQGVSFGVDAQSRFADGTPNVKAFWAAAAAAVGVSGQPFGPNPHTLIGG